MTNENSNEPNRPPNKYERFWKHYIWIPVGLIISVIPFFTSSITIDDITNKFEIIGNSIVDRISSKIDNVIYLLVNKDAYPQETIPNQNIDKNTLCNNDNQPINCLWRE